MKPSIIKMLADARNAGYVVVDLGLDYYDVNFSKRGRGLRITPDGCAFRNDVDLSIALSIRTTKAMRAFLKL
jgi:hypothetical protein